MLSHTNYRLYQGLFKLYICLVYVIFFNIDVEDGRKAARRGQGGPDGQEGPPPTLQNDEKLKFEKGIDKRNY